MYSMHIEEKYFSELSVQEVYEILQLRADIFVIEQNCIYRDIDGKDDQAIHILGKKEDKIIAYARCFAPGIYFKEAAIGRVVVDKNFRKRKFAHQIMKKAILSIAENFQTSKIKISAQQYLIDFYNSHGFKTIGKGYLEDGIPHVNMLKK